MCFLDWWCCLFKTRVVNLVTFKLLRIAESPDSENDISSQETLVKSFAPAMELIEINPKSFTFHRYVQEYYTSI